LQAYLPIRKDRDLMRTATIPFSSSATIPLFRIPLAVQVGTFCLLWASAFSVGKLAVTDCPPLFVLAARFLLAGIIILGAAAIWGNPFKLSRRDKLIFAILGVANQAAALGLAYIGVRSISSGLSALIISANPVLTAVLGALFLNERLTARKVLGLLLGIGGVAFIVGSRLALGADHAVGIAFTVAALISLVCGTILFKRFTPKGGFWIGNGVQSLAAAFAILPFAFIFEKTADIVPSWRLAISVVYLAAVVSIFAYLLWFRLLDALGAIGASSYHFLMPPLGMLFGWLLLGEHMAATDLAGIVPVAAGIYLVTRQAREAVSVPDQGRERHGAAFASEERRLDECCRAPC
jgi:drug/metabolite transporter (DMT)-like permease